MPPQSPPPQQPSPPRLVSATLNSQLTTLQLLFDSPTDRGGLAAAGHCAQVLDPATISLLLPANASYRYAADATLQGAGQGEWEGSDEEARGQPDASTASWAMASVLCYWPTRTTMTVLLPSGTSLPLHSNITVARDAIGSASSPGLFCVERSAPLSLPAVVAPPVALLTGAEAVPTCAHSVTLSAEYSAGGGAFGLLLNWSAQDASNTAGEGGESLAELQVYLASQTPSRATTISIPVSVMPLGPAPINVYVVVRDVTGLTSSAKHTLQRLESPQPTVAIAGSSQVSLSSPTYYVLLTTYYLLLTTYYLLLTTYYLLLTTYYLLLTTYDLRLTTYDLLLTTYYSLLTTHFLLFLLTPYEWIP